MGLDVSRDVEPFFVRTHEHTGDYCDRGFLDHRLVVLQFDRAYRVTSPSMRDRQQKNPRTGFGARVFGLGVGSRSEGLDARCQRLDEVTLPHALMCVKSGRGRDKPGILGCASGYRRQVSGWIRGGLESTRHAFQALFERDVGVWASVAGAALP